MNSNFYIERAGEDPAANLSGPRAKLSLERLQQLNLYGLRLSAIGVAELAPALCGSTMSCLELLSLESNEMGPLGLEADVGVLDLVFTDEIRYRLHQHRCALSEPEPVLDAVPPLAIRFAAEVPIIKSCQIFSYLRMEHCIPAFEVEEVITELVANLRRETCGTPEEYL